MPPAELGYDELSAVMILASGNSIDDKFRLSQVCRTWRDVALSTPRLWACFAVRTMADALRLTTVIRRASPRMSVPMDITLDFAARKVVGVEGKETVVPVITLDDRLGIYQDLEPHMPFVKQLCIELGVGERDVDLTADEPLSRLFTFATPALEGLSIVFDNFSGRPAEGHQAIVPLEAAPRLRSLALTGAIPQDWKTAIGPALETLFLKVWVEEESLLVDILKTCTRLRRFTFLPVCHTDFRFATEPLTAELGCLRELHVGGPVADIWSAISPVLCHAVLDSVTVSIGQGALPGTTAFVGENIFPAAWSPVSCAVRARPSYLHAQQDVRLVDGAGKERRVFIKEPGSCFGDLWRGLVVKTNALDTIASFSFSDWAGICDAFHTDPLRHPELQLRFPLPSFNLFVDPINWHLEMLNCPTAREVILETDDVRRRLELQTLLEVVDHIVHQNTTLCVGDAFAEEPNRSWVSGWLTELQKELSQRNGWSLCNHCAAHI